MQNIRARRCIRNKRHRDESTTQLFALCASHISSLPRIRALQQMIESWNENMVKPLLIISMSSTPDLKSVVTRVIETLCTRYEGLFFVHTEERLSQLQHLQEAAQKAASLCPIPLNEAWIMFTDDDDVWHEARTAVFRGLIGAARENDAFFGACIRYVIGETEDNVKTADDVTALPPRQQIHGDRQSELWHVTMELTTLQKFYETASDTILNHNEGDLFILKFLRGAHGIQMSQGIPYWMYYYRLSSDSLLQELRSREIDDELYDTIMNRMVTHWHFEDPEVVSTITKHLVSIVQGMTKMVFSLRDDEYIVESATNLMNAPEFSQRFLREMRGIGARVSFGEIIQKYIVQSADIWEEYFHLLLQTPQLSNAI